MNVGRELFRSLRSGLRPHTRFLGYAADSIGRYALTQTARAHRYVGAAIVLVFLGTGVYLKLGHPWGEDSNEVVRYLYRANHVYILLAGLVNLGIGIYWKPRTARRSRVLQSAGSVLLLAAPAVLIAAFFLEPPRVPERLITTAGVMLLLLGTMGHAAGRGRA